MLKFIPSALPILFIRPINGTVIGKIIDKYTDFS